MFPCRSRLRFTVKYIRPSSALHTSNLYLSYMILAALSLLLSRYYHLNDRMKHRLSGALSSRLLTYIRRPLGFSRIDFHLTHGVGCMYRTRYHVPVCRVEHHDLKLVASAAPDSLRLWCVLAAGCMIPSRVGTDRLCKMLRVQLLPPA